MVGAELANDAVCALFEADALVDGAGANRLIVGCDCAHCAAFASPASPALLTDHGPASEFATIHPSAIFSQNEPD